MFFMMRRWAFCIVVFLLPLSNCHAKKPKLASELSSNENEEVVKIEGLTDDEKTCSRCRWAARALRKSLGEKLPKKARDDSERRKILTRAALDASQEKDKVCAKRRFPEKIRERQERGSDRIAFSDGDEPQDAHVRYREISEGMEGVIDRLISECDIIMTSLTPQITARAEKFTERVEEFSVATAFTDRWVCHRMTGLCPKEDFPEYDEDEEERDDEL
eukprot:TRINITY_DN59102_c0_g1_i1.p1 TRINITY_DN59102_c0_g1~~TRINITY_DN59102_c0_g1_i1.p1  ORF type:complete len:218 (-),score=27.92 TRINITY_DN59102_c0_g1_i1:37-690(-)